MEITNYQGYQISYRPAENKHDREGWEIRKKGELIGEFASHEEAKHHINYLLFVAKGDRIYEQVRNKIGEEDLDHIISIKYSPKADDQKVEVQLENEAFSKLLPESEFKIERKDNLIIDPLYEKSFIFNNIKYFTLTRGENDYVRMQEGVDLWQSKLNTV